MKIKFIPLAIAALALIASCQDTNQPTPKANSIKFAKIDREATAAFAEGSQIGMFIGTPINADNVKFTVGADGSITPEKELYWGASQTTSSDFLAYSPYTAAYTGAKSGTFEVATDQSAAGAIEASDLLVATTNASPSDPSVNLAFEHKNAKISLYFTNNTGEAIKSVVINDVYTKGQLSLSNGSFTASGDKSSVTCCPGKDAKDKEVYTALIVPQSSKFTVKVTTASDKAFEFPLSKETSFTSGKQWGNADSPLVLSGEGGQSLKVSFSVSDWGDGGALVFEGGEEGEYTTIAELAATATSTASSFSVEVKNVVVTAVYNKYAHLQDKTAGIMFFGSNNPFEEGDCINGTISGTIVLFNGYAQITAIDLTEATITSVTDPIEPMVVTAEELDKNIGNYYNRKVIVKNVTITTGVNSSTTTGKFEQNGYSFQFHNKSKAAVVATGATGDIVGWPTSYSGTNQLVIYTTSNFTEGSGEDMGEDTAFTRTKTYGIYSIPDTATVTPLYSVDAYAQTASLKGGSFRNFNVYDFAAGKALYCALSSANITKGASVSVTVSSLGLDASLNGTYSTTVLGYSNGMAWLKDASSKKGFIISIQ